MQISLPFKKPSYPPKDLLKTPRNPLRSSSWLRKTPGALSQEPARKGYAGTMFLYKRAHTRCDFPRDRSPSTMDLEGRIITLEFDKFFVTQVYTPNAGDGLKRLEERQVWDVKYAEYLVELDKENLSLQTGDYNVAHKEIDLANPASNRRSPGFTDEEREGFTNLLAKGFTDTFRHVHGDVPERYTWWVQRSKTSKINNTGWRIDYWLTSNRIADKVTKSDMIDSGARQDPHRLSWKLNYKDFLYELQCSNSRVYGFEYRTVPFLLL